MHIVIAVQYGLMKGVPVGEIFRFVFSKVFAGVYMSCSLAYMSTNANTTSLGCASLFVLEHVKRSGRVMPPKKTAAKKAVAKKISGSHGPTTTAGGAGACNVSAASCATCGICEQPIIDGKDQALFCEGTCKQWIHRFCAGFPLSWFAILGSSSTPFRCYSCCHAKYADDVDSLTTQIKTLKSELGELKEVVGNLSALSTASQVSAVTGGVSEFHCFTSQSDVGVGGGMGRRGEGGFERERW